MKRFGRLVLLLSFISSFAFAGRGGIGERLFFQVGGTVGADVMHMEGTFVNTKGATNVKDINFVSNNVNFATVQLVGRINFLELSNNSSLSLAFRPSGGFGRAINDIGGTTTTLRLPFTIDINSGAASTVSTRAKTGFSFGIGAEYIMYPAVGEGVSVCNDANQGAVNNNYVSMKGGWWQPVAVVGIKFFGKHYYCREINFKACYYSTSALENKSISSESVVEENFYSKISDFSNVGLMISFMQYLNY